MLEPIYIPANVASSKNSKRWTGKMLINSKTVMEYKRNTQYHWQLFRWRFLKMIENKPKPYRIGFYFIRDSKRAFDFVNVAQLPLDLMQEYGWLENDDASTVVPVFLGCEVNKHKAGLRIEVLE